MEVTSQDNLDALEQRYLEEIAQKTESLKLIEEDAKAKSRPPLLVDVFTMLRASSVVHTLDQDQDIKERDNTDQVETERYPLPLSISTVLQEQQHLALLGSPGSGKTTTLKFIAHCFAANLAEEKVGIREKYVPVLILLKDIVEGKRKHELRQEWLDDWIYDTVSYAIKADLSQIRNLVDHWRDSGHLFVLLDGLDEIPEGFRFEIANKIDQFSRAPEGQRSRIVITSRTVSKIEIGTTFREYELQPLNSFEDLQSYVSRWAQAIEPKFTEEKATEMALRFIKEAQSISGLSQVMKNPLFLHLLVYQYVRDRAIPQNRADILHYYIVSEAWERAQKRIPSPPPQNEVLTVLEYLSWKFQNLEEHDYGNLTKEIQDQFPTFRDVDAVLDFVISGMGLLEIRGSFIRKSLYFMHSSFSDYFIARCLKRSWHIDKNQTWLSLKPLLHHPKWKEPIMLLLHLIDEEGAATLIEHIGEADSPYEAILDRDKLFLAECLKDGVKISDQLRERILEKLLILYLSPKISTVPYRGSNPHPQPMLVRRLESIFESFSKEDKSFLASSLLLIANKQKFIEDSHFVGLKRLFEERYESLKYYYGKHYVETPNLLYKSLVTLQLRVTQIAYFLTSPFLIVDYLGRLKQSRNNQQVSAIESLIMLKHLSPEWIDFLISALRSPDLSVPAAKVLVAIGPFKQEIFDGLLDLFAKDYAGWIGSSMAIELLGMFGQRYPTVVESLIALANDPDSTPRMRWRYIAALGKAAEVSTVALNYILFDVSKYINDFASKADDDGSLQGYIDGLELITVASKEVILYLLNLHLDERSAVRTAAEKILLNLFGVYDNGGQLSFEAAVNESADLFPRQAGLKTSSQNAFEITSSPRLRCKVVLEDSTIGYSVEDFIEFTEYAFATFLESPRVHFFGNPLVNILVYWGWKKPDLLIRLISTILQSDTSILANEIRKSIAGDIGEAYSSPFYLKRPIDPEIRQGLQRSMDLLRDQNPAVREAVLQSWLSLSQEVPSESNLHRLAEIIEGVKMGMLEDVYQIATSQIWGRGKFNWNLYTKNTAFIFAALAHFRGLREMWSHNPPPSVDVMKKTLSLLTESADHLLDERGRIIENVVRLLSPLLDTEEDAFIFRSEILSTKNVELNYWKDARRLSLDERLAAAFALAILAKEQPDFQGSLLTKLDIELLYNGDLYNEELLNVIMHIQNAGRELVAILLEVNKNQVFYDSDQVFDHLTQPSAETFPRLIESLGKVSMSTQRAIIRALGTMEPSTRDLAAFLVGVLKNPSIGLQSAAAEALGNMREPAFVNEDQRKTEIMQIFDALTNSAPHSLEAAATVGKYAERIGILDTDLVREKLSRAAKVLSKVLHSPSSLEFGYAFAMGKTSFEDVTESLRAVVLQLTLVDSKVLLPVLSFNPWADTEARKSEASSTVPSKTKSIRWRVATIFLMIALAIYFALWAVIPNLIADLISVTKIGLQTRLFLVAGFILLSMLSAWLWLKEK